MTMAIMLIASVIKSWCGYLSADLLSGSKLERLDRREKVHLQTERVE